MPSPLPSPAAPPSQGGPVETLPPIRGPLDPGIVAAVELLRAEGLATTDSGDGYSKKEAIFDGQALNFGHVIIQVDQGLSVDDVIASAKAIPWTDYGYRVPKVELLERASDSAADEPEAVGVMWQPGELMDTGDTKAAAVCLHCNQKPATKVEDERGFTLCDGCWHASQTDAPPISPLQAEDMAREIDMLQAINRKLAGARSILERIVLEIGGRDRGELVTREALPSFSLDKLYMMVSEQIERFERFERDSDDATDARNILSWVGYHHEPGGLESALKGALADSRTPARWRHHRRAERARLLGQAMLHEAAAHDHAAAGNDAKMTRALEQAAELELQARTQFLDLED